MTIRTETQVAIRTKKSGGGYYYMEYVDNGPGGAVSYKKLTLETAKNQLSLYSTSAEPTIVTRKVTINEGPWETVDTSEATLLAGVLHRKQCGKQCTCAYPTSVETRLFYREKAEKILKTTSLDTVIELLELM